VGLADRIPWFASASRRKRWLVGVSGGADSVALLHLLVENGFRNLVVCHLDHRLRGRASTEDAKFVRRLAESLGLPCEIGVADVAGRKKVSNASMETEARAARHEFFAGCARKFSCPRIVLAHHVDDQAETVLWNLLRGSKGLKGMRALQELTTDSGVKLELHRPLLEFRHAELVAWLESQGLRWREDASNAQPVAVRNRLRNEVFPLLSEIANRDVVPAFVRGAADSEDAEALESWALEQAKVMDPQGRLHVPAMRPLPVALQRIALWRFLQDQGIRPLDRDLIDRGLGLLDTKGTSAINLPGGGKLRRREGRLWVEWQAGSPLRATPFRNR
jgi:tRNA(Ile)-lysidine synthase